MAANRLVGVVIPAISVERSRRPHESRNRPVVQRAKTQTAGLKNTVTPNESSPAAETCLNAGGDRHGGGNGGVAPAGRLHCLRNHTEQGQSGVENQAQHRERPGKVAAARAPPDEANDHANPFDQK